MTQAWGIYMGRIKRYWDIKHPELNHFTAKNLRDHADCIKKKQVVMTTESLNNVTSTNSVDGITCRNIGTLFNKNLESLKSKPLHLCHNTT